MMKPMREVWFLTSELESERASSFRQERWCQIFLEKGSVLRIFNLRGIFHHSDAICADGEELSKFRSDGVDSYQGPQASIREGMVVRQVRRLKHIFLVDFYLPNIVKLYYRLNKLLKTRDEKVVLIASSPPFSLAVVGGLIKRQYPSKVVFCVDMRDAWALHNALGGIKFIKRGIERIVLRRADYVTTVSNGLANEFRQFYGVEVSVMYNVASHYLDMAPIKQIDLSRVSREINPEKMVLVYTGSTPEHHYDLRSIVGAIQILLMEKPNVAQRLQLVFVGACDELRREAQRGGVGAPYIVFIPHLPHATVRRVQASASALIFLAHHGPNNMGVVSTKLFEYLCLGQSVVPVDLCKGSDVDFLLNRYCGTSINAHGERAVAKLLTQIVENGVSNLPRLEEVRRVQELLEDYRLYAAEVLHA